MGCRLLQFPPRIKPLAKAILIVFTNNYSDKNEMQKNRVPAQSGGIFYQAVGVIKGEIRPQPPFYLDSEFGRLKVNEFQQRVANALLKKGFPEGEQNWLTYPSFLNGRLISVSCVAWGSKGDIAVNQFKISGKVLGVRPNSILVGIQPNKLRTKDRHNFKRFGVPVRIEDSQLIPNASQMISLTAILGVDGLTMQADSGRKKARPLLRTA